MRSGNATIVLTIAASVVVLASGSSTALQDGRPLPIRQLTVDEMSFADKALGKKVALPS